MKFFRFSSLTACVLALFLTLGCGSIGKDETLTWSVQKLYLEAKDSLNSGSIDTARGYYNKILSRYPFGRYAQQANLDMIQLEYKDKEYDKAIAQADKFVQLYPNSQYADYARYMKGVISYSRDVTVIDKLVPTNIAQSDQEMMKKAYEDFEALVAQSPNSDYSNDAKMRMVYLRNVTAEHEIYVAEYYLRRGAYLAAVNRAQYVIASYQTTPSAPLALAVMIRAYQELDMKNLSADARRVLDKNFPNAAKENDRVDFLLNGNIHRKRGFFSSLVQGLTN